MGGNKKNGGKCPGPDCGNGNKKGSGDNCGNSGDNCGK